MTKKTTSKKKDSKIPVQTPDVAYGMKQVSKTYQKIKKEGMPKTITIEVDKLEEGLAFMATHPRIPLDKVKRHNKYAGEILEGMFSYAPFIMEAVEEKIVSMGDKGLTMDDAFEGVANLLQDFSEGVRTLRNHFEDYICDGVDRHMVMTWFKETISHKDGRGMAVMIIAAIQHGWLSRKPSYPSLIDAFKVSSTYESTYNDLIHVYLDKPLGKNGKPRRCSITESEIEREINSMSESPGI